MLRVLRDVDGACDGPVPARADPLAPLRPVATVTACATRW